MVVVLCCASKDARRSYARRPPASQACHHHHDRVRGLSSHATQARQSPPCTTTTVRQTSHASPLHLTGLLPRFSQQAIVPTGTHKKQQQLVISSSMSSLTGRQQANPQQAASVPKQNPMSTMGRIKIRLNRARNLKVRGWGWWCRGASLGVGGEETKGLEGEGARLDGVISAVGCRGQARTSEGGKNGERGLLVNRALPPSFRPSCLSWRKEVRGKEGVMPPACVYASRGNPHSGCCALEVRRGP